MTGRIPKYGENFRRFSVGYRRGWAGTIYVLKRDGAWVIQADRTSEKWHILHHNVPVTRPLPTFGEAMHTLLDGLARGFYAVGTPAGHDTPPELYRPTR